MALRRDDLPAFGRPARAMRPKRDMGEDSPAGSCVPRVMGRATAVPRSTRLRVRLGIQARWSGCDPTTMTHDVTPENQNPIIVIDDRVSQGAADDGLLSHDLAVVVPSALQGLTAVFGMGTGVAPARWSPAIIWLENN